MRSHPYVVSSRMCFYTGRYMQSHGAHWNGFPLKVGEMTLGDYLRPMGMQTVLVGKTHMYADLEGMERLGLSRDSVIGARVAECGFDAFERDDGLWGEGPDGFYDKAGDPAYNHYLREKGYTSHNPWHDFANAGVHDDGEMASGWFMKYAKLPANIAEEDSETPYMTRRAMAFIEQAQDNPWCLHLSYIKPHWPYIVPAPYHDMYGPDEMLPVVRSEEERKSNPHPVYQAFFEGNICKAFHRDEVREAVVPAYMGLIKQCDDQIGCLFHFLQEKGLWDNTMIVVTSDHGDYLGDHWMGEKDLFHEPSVKIPLIIYDPSAAADATRGGVCDELVESIDVAATFVQVAGGEDQSHRLEGCSLMPFLHGENPQNWREYVISEYDYSLHPASLKLEVEPKDARLYMVADKRWKLMHAKGFRSQLFDLENDPQELNDLGADPAYAEIIQMLFARLTEWALRDAQRTTRSDQQIRQMRGASRRKGIIIGAWDEADIAAELTVKYRGKPQKQAD